MADGPTGRMVHCPECSDEAMAILPPKSRTVSSEETADGKVWVTCRSCGNRFLVYYQIDG